MSTERAGAADDPRRPTLDSTCQPMPNDAPTCVVGCAWRCVPRTREAERHPRERESTAGCSRSGTTAGERLQSSHARHDVASRGIQQLLTPHPPGREPTSIRRRYRRTIASGGPARARAADAERPRVPCLRERSRELCDEHAHERGSARERHATCSMRVAYKRQRREAGAASTGGVAAACRRAARRT